MGRYTEAVCKLCRREGVPLMLKGQKCYTDKCAIKKKKGIPGPPRKRRTKLSEYGVQLREKQKIKRSYGLMEKQFRLIFVEANRLKGVTGQNMLMLLEKRLDNVVYRMGFASSRAQARQFINHGHVKVNDKVVSIASYEVKENSVISVCDEFKNNIMLEDSIKLAKAIGTVPAWIEVDFDNRHGKILKNPERIDINSNFNEQLVVELYSK